MTLASAISAMLIYRLVSWIFISAIGWVVFFFMFRTEKDIDPDATATVTSRSRHSSAPTRRGMNPNPSEARRTMRRRWRTFAVLVGIIALTVACTAPTETPIGAKNFDHRRRRPRTRTHGGDSAVGQCRSRAPIPVPATDGKVHLAYELLLTNVLSQELTLTSLAVRAVGPNAVEPGR